MIISSRSNPTVKLIRALRQRKERQETGLFFVEGIRIVAEAVALEAPIQTVVLAPELLRSAFAWEIVTDLERHDLPVVRVTPGVFATLSVREGPQGIGAVIRQRWERIEYMLPQVGLCWVALGGVQDPGNLGTIIRTGDAVGAAGIILVGPSADPHDPEALRASMGAIFSQRLARGTLTELAAWKVRHGVRAVGTSDAAAQDYETIHYPGPLLLFMGSEREGLSPEQAALCDVMVRIPMVGRSDSLNLAIATGVMLYEIFNQRGRPGFRPSH